MRGAYRQGIGWAEAPTRRAWTWWAGGEKRENQAYWKARTGCNKRWVVEGVFSMFKRLFGGHLMALKWESIVQEVRLKAILYNKWRDESMEREAGGGTS
ncbi:MAG: hypothetical protein OXK17_02585 [Thaumarchaeota archaeon]|nr:hypothetical protein [Nitrososphaerota archaeon]